MSILVHPDKNQDDPDRAQKAFEGINTHIYTSDNVYLIKKKYIKNWLNLLLLFSNSLSSPYNVEAVDKAYKLLLDQEQKKRILDVIHAGQEYIEHMVTNLYVNSQTFHAFLLSALLSYKCFINVLF